MRHGTFCTSRLWIALAVVLSLGGACGPIGYVNQVTRKAGASVAAAKAVKADEYSPYWYTRAVEYLHKAREEASFADYQAANRFGRKAHEAALKAKQEAIERAADPSNTDWMPPPGAPGNDGETLAPADGDDSGMAPADGGGLAPADGDGMAPADATDDATEPKKQPAKKSRKRSKKTRPRKSKSKKAGTSRARKAGVNGGLAPVIEDGDAE